MKIVIQRSKQSRVKVFEKTVGEINFGLVVLVGFTNGDSNKEIDYLINKLINLRIFNDESGIMNKSLIDVKGEILSISQFTLYADTKRGRRPSYTDAMNPSEATLLYDSFNQKLENLGIKVGKGIFGADMFLEIENDGPVTIVMESEK